MSRGSVVATTPQGMAEAQAVTITWVDRKIHESRAELGEARQTYDALHAVGQRTAPATGLIRKARRRLEFYEKVRAALDAGYYVIPPFPVQVFALRVDRDVTSPDENRNTSSGRYEQHPAPLPAGLGEYVDPQPRRLHVETKTTQEKRGDGSTYPVTTEIYANDDWRDAVFPLKACKPQIVEATIAAMSLKIFDALGIAPAYRAADPIIVGRIRNAAAPRWNAPLTFFVAWWLDEKDL